MHREPILALLFPRHTLAGPAEQVAYVGSVSQIGANIVNFCWVLEDPSF